MTTEGLPVFPIEQAEDLPPAAKPVNGHDSQPAEVYPAGPYSVVRLVNGDELSRQLFPKFVERAMGFIDRTGSDTDKIWLGNALYTAFLSRSAYFLMLVALDEDGEIVGHGIIYPEPWQKLGYVAHVLQCEIGRIETRVDENGKIENGVRSKDIPSDDILDAAFLVATEWAKKLGMKTMMNQTSTLAHARLYERHGFRLYRYITRKDLE